MQLALRIDSSSKQGKKARPLRFSVPCSGSIGTAPGVHLLLILALGWHGKVASIAATMLALPEYVCSGHQPCLHTRVTMRKGCAVLRQHPRVDGSIAWPRTSTWTSVMMMVTRRRSRAKASLSARPNLLPYSG